MDDPFEYPFITVRTTAHPTNHNAFVPEDMVDVLALPWPNPSWAARTQHTLDTPPVQPEWPPHWPLPFPRDLWEDAADQDMVDAWSRTRGKVLELHESGDLVPKDWRVRTAARERLQVLERRVSKLGGKDGLYLPITR